jgi:hypothetical protein
MTNNTEQRRAFEDGYLGPLCRERYADTGKYRDGAVERDWILFQVGWQAALSQREHDGDGLPERWSATVAASKIPAVAEYIAELERRLAPLLCTAEEAAELARDCGVYVDGISQDWQKAALTLNQLAAIINADRAKR